MRGVVVAASVAACVLLAGCATVVRGTTEPVQFDSEPSGAEMRSVVDYPCGGPCPTRDDQMGGGTAYADENVRTEPVPGPACITPCTVQVARNQNLIVTFTKPGYHPRTAKLTGQVSGGGAVGLVTDGVTGAALDHTPNPLKVTLVPIASPGDAKSNKKR